MLSILQISKHGIIAFCFIVILSCENQVNINLPGDPLPVAYCLLDLQDTIQRISIRYTYLIKNESLSTAAKNSKQDIQDDFSAYIQRFVGGESREIHHFILAPDYHSEGNVEDNPVIVLESQCNVVPDSDYEVHVFKNEDEILNARTRSVGKQQVLDPIPVPGRELTLTPVQGYQLRWSPVKNAGVYQVLVYFNYKELFDQELITERLIIPLRININSEQVHNITQFFSGNHFYKAISDGIEQVSGIRRKAISLDFEVLAGGKELSIYVGQEVNGMSDFGNLDAYSNFDDGKGLFSSRSSYSIKDIKLSYISHDSLSLSLLTRNLGFLKHDEDL